MPNAASATAGAVALNAGGKSPASSSVVPMSRSTPAAASATAASGRRGSTSPSEVMRLLERQARVMRPGSTP